MRGPADTGTSRSALERAGLAGLFAGGPVAFRRVDAVTPAQLVVDGVRLSRALVAVRVQAGQWLRFEARGDAVSVRVDLRATLSAEARLNELFGRLAGGWQPVR